MKMYVKIWREKIKLDMINMTIILVFFSLFIQQTFEVSGIIYFFIDIPIVFMLLASVKKITTILYKNKVYFLLLLVLIFSLTTSLHSVIVNRTLVFNAVYGFYKY